MEWRRPLKNALERVADPRDYVADEAKGQAVVSHLNRMLEADGLAIIVVSGRAHLVPRDSAGSALAAFVAPYR